MSDDPVYVKSNGTTYAVTVSGNNYHLAKLDDDGEPNGDEYVFRRTVGEDNEIHKLEDNSEQLGLYSGQIINTVGNQFLYVKEGQAYMLQNRDGGKVGDAVKINDDGSVMTSEDEAGNGAEGTPYNFTDKMVPS